ncbi:hypothetical protein [Bradyrhizobium erythrophlei]|uniref:Tetratricopeptide repeat-containing protein n=1 Tax=Bradyrhizobium erythrophlei TaxID=1437360 RepID=A0A1M5R478_9BRAD|nr:hypothetical protein [Bradyrhizobium erythrophlei]SHH20830.1 hypothetical protein SAMN05444169_6321 [Bradyrhizobium erythrophlei]
MTSTNLKTRDTETVTNIEKDLVAARRDGRFEDALHHLDEIFVFHKHTESALIRARCAVLLAAPELQEAA